MPKASAVAFVNLVEQQREVEFANIDVEAFAKGVTVDAAQEKAFYDANAAAFKTPEEAKFEYVVLTQDTLLAQVAVTPEEVKAQYDSAAKTYRQEEQRQAAHILIAVKPDASEAERAAAKKTADEIAAQAKANPAKFGELAKQRSQDPGSAPQGGDLGSNPRGTMVKAFDDAVFAMKPGEITGPVQSEFGWHVIRLVAVTPEKTRAFDEVKAQIETELKRQKVGQKFAAAADQFQNLVYEQADSLAPVAKALGLTIQTSPLVTRAQAQQIALGSAKLVQALFCARVGRGQAQHRRHRGRQRRDDGGADRRVQAGRRAPIRRREGRDSPPVGESGGLRARQEGRTGKTGAAGAGQERQGRRRHVLEAGRAGAQPAAARIHQ